MNKSENIGNLAKALAIVQSKLQPAAKDAKNPFFKSNYSTLNSVWDSCRELLAANGLAVVQTNDVSADGVIVETVLMHESNEWISGRICLPLTKHDAQGVGSAISYGRRYGLASIIGIVSDEDDDGNAASQPKQHRQQADKPNGLPIAERIKNVSKAISELGGKVEQRASNESEQAYFESLVEQWNRLK